MPAVEMPEMQIVPTPEEKEFPFPPEIYRKSPDDIIKEEEIKKKGPPTLH